MTPTLVIDASVLCKAFFDKDGAEEARALLASGRTLTAPSLIAAEVANVARKRLRNMEATQDQVYKAVVWIREGIVLLQDDDLIENAIGMAMALDHSAYDCFYLAAAERTNSLMVTSDLVFFNKVQQSQCKHLIVELKHFAHGTP